MYCSRCGKKVLDSMLFCPFCGAQIIIPDQDAPEPIAEEKPSAEPVSGEETSVFSFDLPEDDEPGVEAEVPEAGEPAAWPEESEPTVRWEGIHGARSRKKPPEEEPPEEPQNPVVEDLFPWEAEADEEAEPALPEAEEAPEPPAKAVPAPERVPERTPEADRPVDRRGKNAGNIVPGHRSKGTYVPDKPLDKAAMFLDDADFDDDLDDEDDFDAYDDDTDDYDDFEDEVERESSRKRRGNKKGGRTHRRDDDDDGEPGFLMRHIRGVVGVLLFLVLLAVLALYALSDAGQRRLATINATLPLRADIYKVMAYEYYQSGDYARSGVYYERALAREPGNYDYAASAAMAYLSAGDNDHAAEMLRKCVSLKPEAVEPYLYLLQLYPNANSRPWDVAQLLKQGYEKTGDQRLQEAAANGAQE